jgi:hypothetical protein
MQECTLKVAHRKIAGGLDLQGAFFARASDSLDAIGKALYSFSALLRVPIGSAGAQAF